MNCAYLLCTHITTADEESDILMICWTVIDIVEEKIILVRRNIVNLEELCKIYPQFLDEQVNDIICTSLKEALQWWDMNRLSGMSILVTDGITPLRQCLYPEATKKGIRLSSIYSAFFDIRKEYRKFYNNFELNSLTDIIKLIGLEPSEGSYGVRQTTDLANAVLYLLKEHRRTGFHCFRELEIVKTELEYGVFTKDEVIDDDLVVRVRGLPWQSSDKDVARFFIGLNIMKGGVALCLDSQGKRNGEALVCFETIAERDLALKRHHQFMKNRYIEVYEANGNDFLAIAAGSIMSGASKEVREFLTQGATTIIRMRGLPYNCSARQIVEFFHNGSQPIDVFNGEGGVLFVNKNDGSPTGDAFVLINEEDADKALKFHKNIIGSRYIELFLSTTAEVQQKLPNGEAFIQMDTETSAAACTTERHNKHMRIGKKERYIEVFQCSNMLSFGSN